jgi:cytochrome c-type biogenesis protein CcmH/NrfF
MRRFKRSFLFFVLAAAALAQSESQLQSDEVKRVGVHMNCQCGGCNENLNCNMSAGQCHFCKPARAKIYQMESAGMSDSGIIASFVKEYGDKILRPDPNSLFWVVPYVALGLAGLVLVLVLRSLMRKRPGMKLATVQGPVVDDDPELARYRDAIEKETSKLE